MAKESLVGRWLSPCGCLVFFAFLSEAGGEKRGVETLNRKEHEEYAKDARREFSPCRERAAWQKAALIEPGGEKKWVETLNRKEHEEFWGYMQPTRRGDARLEVIMQ